MNEEQKVLQAIDGMKDEIVAFLKKLVSIPSVTGEELEIQTFLARRIKEMGLEVDLWEPDLEALKKHPAYLPSDNYRSRPNLVGIYRGTGGGKSLLFNGHVDVIPAGPEDAWRHPQKNEITRVLGHDNYIVPDCHHIKLYGGDAVVLCTDGLCGVLPQNTIVETVLGASTADEACAALAAAANSAGGPDNVSVVIVKPGNLPSLQAVIESETSVKV